MFCIDVDERSALMGTLMRVTCRSRISSVAPNEASGVRESADRPCPTYPSTDIATLTGPLDNNRRHPPSTRNRRDIERMLHAAIIELGGSHKRTERALISHQNVRDDPDNHAQRWRSAISAASSKKVPLSPAATAGGRVAAPRWGADIAFEPVTRKSSKQLTFCHSTRFTPGPSCP